VRRAQGQGEALRARWAAGSPVESIPYGRVETAARFSQAARSGVPAQTEL
jgi:hypothetical protein